MSDTNLQLIFSEVHSIKTQIKELTNEVHERNNLQLYTKQETARILKISIRTLTSYMSQGKISPTYHDRAVRFRKKEIDRYIRENTIS